MKFVARWLVITLILSGCEGGPVSTVLPSVPRTGSSSPASDPTSSSAPAPSPSPTPSVSAAPTASPAVAFPADTVVRTTVDLLSLREGPGTDSPRIGLLAVGTLAFVLEGPRSVGGLSWYRITGMGLPQNTGCLAPNEGTLTCPAFAGWVASADLTGPAWLERASVECPKPTLRSIASLGGTYRLACWPDQEIRFDAWWPELPADGGLGGACAIDAPGGFLYCERINYTGIAAEPRGDELLSLSLDPASGVQMPARGQSIRVTGRFDHPAAPSCADLVEGDEDPGLTVFRCRLQFVPSEVVPLGS